MKITALVVGCGLAGLAACSGGDGGGGPVISGEHPRIYLGGNKARLDAAFAAKTPSAVAFQGAVDEWLSGGDNAVYGLSRWNLALMGVLSGDPKYCTAAIAQVDMQVTAANTAIAAGNAPDVAGDDYLYVGDDIGDLAITYDWCNDALTNDQKTAWLAYGQQAVTNVWNPTTASWGGKPMSWSGWAIDDPMDNYYYSFLRATMLFGLAAKDDLPAANQWIAQFHDTKLNGELLPAFDKELVGGGSREGTSYGGSMRNLWELYDWWDGSTGEVLATMSPQTRASMLDKMHAIVPTLDFIAPTGDQARDSTAPLFDYDRQYLNELVTEFPMDPQVGRVEQLLASSSVPVMSEKFMAVYDFLYDHSDVTKVPLDGLNTAYYSSGTGQLYARSGWDTHATWINLTAGPYTESHAHQDQGALMIYQDGWQVFDAVVDSHSGLTQDTGAHSLVRITDGSGDVEQQNGLSATLSALHQGPGWLHFAADITPVYAGSSAVTRAQREVVFLLPSCVIVYDRLTLGSGATAVFQLAMPNSPTLTATGATATAFSHALTVQKISGDTTTSAVHSFTSDGSDYMGGFRYDETVQGGGERHLLHVLWLDGSVGTAVAQGDSGVAITFGDGGTATVTFDPEAVNGTLALKPSGAAEIDATLTPGVDTLTE